MTTGNRHREKTCVLALDQGTTSSRAILFDRRGVPLGVAQEEFPQHVRTGDAGAAADAGCDLGIVEHDPEDIWRTQLTCGRRVLEQAGMIAEQVAAIGITNQRETTILWDRVTGRPVAPAIVWQSRVSAPICQRLKARGLEDDVRRRTVSEGRLSRLDRPGRIAHSRDVYSLDPRRYPTSARHHRTPARGRYNGLH